MADALQLEIVTPAGLALRAQVAEMTAPSVAGEFGVLPGHVPVLAALRAGTVTYKQGSEEHKVAVGPGFVEVIDDKAVVLTEKFSKREQIDVIQTRIRLKEVDDELAAWAGDITDPRRAELIEEEQWLGALLELHGDPPPPTLREDTRFVQRTDEVIIDSGDGAAEDTTTTTGAV